MTISTNTDMFYGHNAADIPGDKKDALSVMRHELGHALGFSIFYDKWEDRVDVVDGQARFDLGGGVFIPLAGIDANGKSHIDESIPDLMNLTVGLGNRRDISDLDLKMLQAAFGYEICPEPSSLALLGVGLLGLAGSGWLRRRKAA